MSKREQQELPVIETNIFIDIIVPEEFQEQVKFLTHKINNKEWSGILLYSVTGDINDFENFKITLQHIHLMDIGSGGATDYELDESIVELKMSDPKFLSYKMGHIHSHHNMDAYFSVTDKEEIVDNSEFYNYYLSVIVNNHGKMVGKIAFRGNINSLTAKRTSGELYSTNLQGNYVFIYQCAFDKQFQSTVNNNFVDRYHEIIKLNAEKNNKKTVTTTEYPNNNTYYNKEVIPFKNRNITEEIEDNEEEKNIIEDFILYIFTGINDHIDRLDPNEATELFDYIEMIDDKTQQELFNNVISNLDQSVGAYFGFGVESDDMIKSIIEFINSNIKGNPSATTFKNLLTKELIKK